MKDVKGYEGLYAVTPEGEVWSYKSNKFLKPKFQTDGYLFVSLCKNGLKKNYRIHRLVSEAYIPNPENLPQVDHINEDKTNNCVNNLQWITNRDNSRKSKNKPILQFDLDGNFIRDWECASDVGKEVKGHIYRCLKGRQKTAYGFVWKYKN